jgi:hypothetical protein
VSPLRIAAVAAWVLLAALAIFGAPPAPDTGPLVLELFRFEGPDPLIAAAFQMMGIWPMLYARVLLRGLAAQRPTPWLFVLASFAVGAFALLPAIALRRFGAASSEDPRWLRRFTEGRGVGVALALAAFALMGWGLAAGDVGVALEWWRTHGFVFTFGLDFATLTLFYPALVAAERRAGADAAPA